MPVSAPKVSVVLPSLNVISYIRECVESVLAQTLRDIEVICVDAGSTDGTLEVLREYEARDSRVRVLISEKKSYGRQMNMGVDAATGAYLAIVETDDMIPPDMLEELYEIAQENSLDFVKADFYRFTVNPDGTLKKTRNRLTKDKTLYNEVFAPSEDPKFFRLAMNTWSGIYSLGFLRRWNICHNETPGASYQDNGFWFQTFCRSERAMFVNKAYYLNRRDNPNSSVFSTSKVYSMRDEYDFIRGILDSDPESLGRFIPLCNYYRFCGYRYNTVCRIAVELRRDFIHSWSEEFRHLAESHELDLSLFTAAELRDLNRIIYAPDEYYADNLREASRFRIVDSSYRHNDPELGLVKVSVIVPVYNVENYLSECLDSILAQTLRDIEVICIDDGSTDSSFQILERYAARDSRVSVITKENGGLSSARNCGLAAASGEFVLFVDSDDLIAKDAAESLYALACKESAEIVVFGFDTIGEDSRPCKLPSWLEKKNPVRQVRYPAFNASALFEERGAKPYACFKFVRRRLLAENQILFPESLHFGEDMAFLFELFPYASGIIFTPRTFYHYRCDRAGSLMHTHRVEQAEKASRHTAIVRHIYHVWDCADRIGEMRIKFTEWAIDFFYGEFDLCEDKAKQKIAREFVATLRLFLDEGQMWRLGPGRRKKLEEILFASRRAEEGATAPTVYTEEGPTAHGDSDQPLVSIVVPVYNMEEYIARTLDSLLGQSLEQIEVICVDDASTDGTRDVLQRYMEVDKRLHVLFHETNQTANISRKEGVMAARGEFIMFCDADDTLDGDACEVLCREMRENPVDILHFGTNVRSMDAAVKDVGWFESNVVPSIYRFEGSKVFEACYRGKLFNRALWDKMYAAELAKAAFADVKDVAIPRGQDAYAFALLAFRARSYRGIPRKLYNYSLGSGGDGRKRIDLKSFSAFCSLSLVPGSFLEFMVENRADGAYLDVLADMRNQLFADCLNKWQRKLDDADKPAGYEMMKTAWGAEAAATGVARRYWNSPRATAPLLTAVGTRPERRSGIHTIAAYYHKIKGGGAENVMRYLANVWQRMGYRVVLISDLQSYDDAADDVRGFKQYMIPNDGIGSPASYEVRAKRLAEIIEVEKVDAVVYHAWNTGLLPWDMLTVKSLGAFFIIHCHSIFSIRLRLGQAYFSDMPPVFSAADAVVCLSETDEYFWGRFCGNVHRVVNPARVNADETMLSKLDSKKVLWVGRLSDEKRPEDALRAFEKVYKVVPGAQLEIVGSAESKDYEKRLHDLAEFLGISGSVEFRGFQEDVAPYMRTSALLLMTSDFEGFPLTLAEAQSYGLPVVMYSLPYITLAKENEGLAPVGFGDIDGLAREVIDLLEDGDLRRMRGAASFSHVQAFRVYDFTGAWRGIFDSLLEAHPQPELDEREQNMWTTLLDHYRVGSTNSSWRSQQLSQQLSGEKRKARQAAELAKMAAKNERVAQKEKYEKSNSWRVGRVMTSPIRWMKRCKRRSR